MKKFQFSLEKVLSYKQQRQDALRSEHAEILAQVHAQEALVESLWKHPEFPYSSPIIPWSGNFLEIASRSMHSTFLSTSVTGEESFLKSTLCRFPKDFAMYSPLMSASSLIKTLKDCVCMGVM